MSRALLVLRAPREACRIDCTERPQSDICKKRWWRLWNTHIFERCARNGSFAQNFAVSNYLDLQRVIEGSAEPKMVPDGHETKRGETNLPCRHSLVFISCWTPA